MHMLFETKDEKIENLERRIYNMEKKLESNMRNIDDTVSTLNKIILKLQVENTRLRSERDFLVERHKKMLKRVPVPDLAAEINERLVKPAVDKIRENAEFVGLVAKEDFVEVHPRTEKKEVVHERRKNVAKELKKHIEETPKPNHGKTIDGLFELVSKSGCLRADEAARKLNVHEVQIEEWGRILEDHDLVTLKKNHFGKIELVKV